MKNKIRSKKIIAIMLFVILMFTANVYAANDSFNTALSVNNSQVKRGENITITITLSDIAIESGEKGIGAYTAGIDFDSTVLEYVSTNGTDKWEAPLYQENLITGNTDDGEVINTTQNIGTITFKVKENAKLGETTIKLINFSGSTAGTDVSANDSSVKVTILDKDGGSGNQGGDVSQSESENQGENANQGGDTNQNSNTQNGKNENNDSKLSTSNTDKGNTKQGVLPKAGNPNMLIHILIIVCTLVAISLFIKIKLLNKKIKRNL